MDNPLTLDGDITVAQILDTTCGTLFRIEDSIRSIDASMRDSDGCGIASVAEGIFNCLSNSLDRIEGHLERQADALQSIAESLAVIANAQ